MIMKKAKHIIGHLREGGRILIELMSNIVNAKIFSGLQDSILENGGFFNNNGLMK